MWLCTCYRAGQKGKHLKTSAKGTADDVSAVEACIACRVNSWPHADASDTLFNFCRHPPASATAAAVIAITVTCWLGLSHHE